MTIHKIETPTGSVLHTQIIRGTVISVATRTEFTTVRDRDTHLGGGKMLPGQVYNEASTVRDIWLKTEEGKEMKLPFGGLGLAMREGHEVAFIYAKDGTGEPRCLASRNFTTGESIVSTDNTVRMAGEKASRPPKVSLGAWVQIPTICVISYFIAMMDRPGRFAFGIFGACVLAGLCVMGVIWLIRVNARNKQAGAEAVDILRGRLQGLSAQ